MKITIDNYTLADFCKENHDGLDITGTDWDWGEYFECEGSLEECKDGYDKVMYYIGTHVYINRLDPEWCSVTTIEEFLHEHQKTFEKFINQCYKEEYIPDWDKLDPDSQEWYELFMDEIMAGLLCGNFAISDYDLLYDCLTKEVK
mgnify:FL=1